MEKSIEKKLVKILNESDLNPKMDYLCKSYIGKEMILNYKEASVYNYILDAYNKYEEVEKKYLKNLNIKNTIIMNKAIKDYDTSREVLCYLNQEAYMKLVD